MGDRASVSFSRGPWESVTLFSHWGGKRFQADAQTYADGLKQKPDDGTPLGRRDPPTVMVDFIRQLTKDLDEVKGDLYLGIDQNDGDNSNEGHVTVNLE